MVVMFSLLSASRCQINLGNGVVVVGDGASATMLKLLRTYHRPPCQTAERFFEIYETVGLIAVML